MRITFYTLGCKVNLYETQALTQLAVARGHEIVKRDADAVIINTCTVTSIADHKNIRAIHKLRRDNPNAVIAACGCMAETRPDKLRAAGAADLIFGTHNRAQVLERCEAAVRGRALPHPSEAHEREAHYSEAHERGAHERGAHYNNNYNNYNDTNKFELLPAGVPQGRTRALLKIEDGCDNYCAYCIIPYARGHVRSMPVAEVLRQAERLAQDGAQEIVLTGIELASYGRDLQTPTGATYALTDLLETLLPLFPDIRFRLGSLDPRIADEDFCARLQGFNNLARHFHLSLQSGSDSVLRRMGRRYTTDLFAQNVKRLRTVFPRCSVTADIITGFPGETEEEFRQTLEFLQRCAFASVHVFPYSPREGTRAAAMPDQIPQSERETRAERARQTARLLSERYRQDFLGETLPVLPEHRTDGLWAAHGPYGFPIYLRGDSIQKNVPETVRITALCRDGLLAEKIQFKQ